MDGLLVRRYSGMDGLLVRRYSGMDGLLVRDVSLAITYLTLKITHYGDLHYRTLDI